MIDIIDAHFHIYSQDTETYPRIDVKTPTPPEPAQHEDYTAIADKNEITKAVFVQPAVYGSDTSYLRDICTAYPSRFVAVVIADYATTAGHNLLLDELENPYVRGARFHLLAEQRSHSDILSDDAIKQSMGFVAEAERVIELHINDTQFDIVKHIAERFDKATIVVDHLGYPEPGKRVDSRYAAFIRSIDSLDNVFMKVSGYEMKSIEGYPFEDLRVYAEAVLQALGCSRCMWASNYPYITLTATMQQCIALGMDLSSGDKEDQGEFLNGTAERVFWGST
jgi:predicted TIM-barrel fold metal-dependent hydrolase